MVTQESSSSIIPLSATAPYVCSYLHGKFARSQIVPGHVVDSHVYAQLLEQGFRRSGMQVYRPHCDACRACMSLRIPVQQFQPSRSQRRAWRRHATLSVRILPLVLDAEHWQVYQAYQSQRHRGGGMDGGSVQDYQDFILESSVHTVLVEFRDKGVLKMVSVVDMLADALSAVYTFYAHDAQAAYGTYAILWQIAYAKQHHMRHVYLGYWVENSDKMHYKTQFCPHELWTGQQWELVSARAG